MARPSAAASAIDFAHLDRFTNGDVAITREVLRLFRIQTGELVALLQGTPDPVVVRQTLHALKGAARAVGAWQAAEIAQGLEQAEAVPASRRRDLIAALAAAFATAHEVALAFETGPDTQV